MPAFATGSHFPDLVNYVQAFGNLAEYAIAPAVATWGFKVEKTVVDHIDKELSCCRVWITGAGHGQRASLIFHSVIRLILNRFLGRFLIHSGFKSATLNHESFYHPVKNCVVVEAGATIGQKVLDGGRRFRIERLNNNIAVAGVQSDHDRFYAAKYIGSMGVSTGRILLWQTGRQLVCPSPNAVGNFRPDVRRFGLPLVGYDENRKIFGRTQDDDTAETGSFPIFSDQAIMLRGLSQSAPAALATR